MIQGVPTTPLIEACYKGNIIAVQELVSNGEDVNQIDSTNQFPLYVALLWMHVEIETDTLVSIVRLLLAAGADPNAVSPTSGNTMIHMICRLVYHDDVIAHLLIDFGATWPEGAGRNRIYQRIISKRDRLKRITCRVLLPARSAGGLRMVIRIQVAKHLWSMRFEKNK